MDQADLEMLVDRIGMAGVLRMLADVCADKAEHVRSTWDDPAMARMWDRVFRVLDRTAAHKDITALKGIGF
jgi:hypothetical protein